MRQLLLLFACVYCSLTAVWAAEKSLTFTLPPNAPDSVSWQALPHPDSPHKDVWAPHETTTTIQATLPTGRWTVIATGMAETEYRADITISEALPDDLTVIIPYHNIAGGDGLPTAPEMLDASAALIAALKSTFIDLQMQQATAHTVKETQQQVADFMQKARYQVGDADYKDIKDLLTLMGKPFAKTLAAWQAAEPDLLVIEENEPGYGEDIALICDTAPSCPFIDKDFNLRLTVPNGWVLSFPYIYETAGGAKAEQASITFIRQKDGKMVSLNVRQASGKCLETRSGRLCYFAEDNIHAAELGVIITGAN